MEILKQVLFTVTACALAFPSTVFAACDSGSGFDNPLKCSLSSVAGFTEGFLRAVVYIMFPIAVIFIVYSGFLFVVAQGKPDDLSKAKTNFFWTVIGVGLLLGAWALAVLIKGTIDPLLGT